MSRGQHPVSYTLTDEAGLPSNELYRVVQDPQGYVWIGCDAGLFRYDGFRFKAYRNREANGRAVSFVQVDALGQVWCKNFFGQIYRVRADSLELVSAFDTSDPSYPQFGVDVRGQLWYYRGATLVRYLADTRGEQAIVLPGFAANEYITSVHSLADKLLVISSELRVFLYHPDKQTVRQLVWPQPEGARAHNSEVVELDGVAYILFHIEGLAQHKFVVRTNGRVAQVAYRTQQLGDRRIYGLSPGRHALWLCSSAGAVLLKPQSDGALMATDTLFANEKVSSVCIDREGQHWFTTLQNGLRVVPQYEVWRYDRHNSALADDNLTSLHRASDGSLYLGSYLGKVFRMLPGGKPRLYLDATDTKLISTKTVASYADYLLVSHGSLSVIDRRTGRHVLPAVSNVRDLARMHDSLFLVLPQACYSMAVADLLAPKPKLRKLTDQGGRAVAMAPDSQLLYFALGKGTFVRTAQGAWHELRLEGQPLYVSDLAYDQGLMWLSTLGQGVLGYRGRRLVYRFQGAKVLGDNIPRTLHCRHGELWVSTDKHLFRIHYASGAWARFDFTHSVSGIDINAIELDDSLVYLATKKGLLRLPRNLAWENRQAPRLRIDSVLLDHRPLAQSGRYQLPFQHQNVEVYLSSTAFKSRGRFRYRYRLAQRDTAWAYLPASNPVLRLERLGPGKHLLELQSQNEHHHHSPSIVLYFVVRAPLWHQWWFYLGITLVGSVLVTVVYVWQVRRIRRWAHQKNLLIDSQLTALKAQMNPHFLFNSLNSIQDLVMRNDQQLSSFYLNKFSQLMRRMLDASDKPQIRLSQEIEMLDAYLQLEKLRFGDTFQYRIDVADELPTDDLWLPPMLVQPFVENAVKHGLLHKKGDRRLFIHFWADGKALHCALEDNGVGRKRVAQIQERNKLLYKSFATKATERRVELLSQLNGRKYHYQIIDLEENGQALGTRVELSIPF